MSRSAADATRFTATGPYASSKPNSSSRTPYNLPSFMAKPQQNNKPPQQGAGGKQETPKEKVDRLRAQARAARMAQAASSSDRWIDFGRRFANKAHKTMVYALIATSGVCGVLTVYSMVSLALYNRRQRALWVDRELEKLQQARMAYVNDTATPEQIEMLKNEKIGEIMKQKKEEGKEQRPWNQVKSFLFGGLKKDEAQEPGQDEQGGFDNKPGVLEAVNAKAAEDFKTPTTPSPQQPGQLDVLADNAESVAKQSARSWKSWFTGR